MAQPPLGYIPTPGQPGQPLSGPPTFHAPSPSPPPGPFVGDSPRPISERDKRMLEGYRALYPNSAQSDEQVIRSYGLNSPGGMPKGDPDYFFKQKASQDQYRAATGGPVFDAYRKANPGSGHLSDDDIARDYLEQYGEPKLRMMGYDKMVDRANEAQLEKLRPRNIPTDEVRTPYTGRGFWSQKYHDATGFGGDTMPALVQSGLAWGTDAVGWKGGTDYLLQAVEDNKYWMDRNAPLTTPGLHDPASQGVLGKLNWGAGVIAEQLPVFIATLGMGAAGGVAGKTALPKLLGGSGAVSGFVSRTAARRAAESGILKGGLDDVAISRLKSYAAGGEVSAMLGNTAAKAAVTAELEALGTLAGAAAGAYSVTFPMEAGGNIFDLLNEGKDIGEIGMAPVAFGAVQAALDIVGPMYIAKTWFSGPVSKATASKPWSQFAAKWPGLKSTAMTMGIEGTTEAAQEMLSFASNHYANGEPLFEYSDEEWKHIKEAGAAGAVMGGVMGGATAAITNFRESKEKDKNTEQLIDLINENLYDIVSLHPRLGPEIAAVETKEITDVIMDEGAAPVVEEGAVPEVVVATPAEPIVAEGAEVAEIIYGPQENELRKMARQEIAGTLKGDDLNKKKADILANPESRKQYNAILLEETRKENQRVTATPAQKAGALDTALGEMSLAEKNEIYSHLGRVVAEIAAGPAQGFPSYSNTLGDQREAVRKKGSKAHGDILDAIMKYDDAPLEKQKEIMELAIPGVAKSPLQHALGAYIRADHPEIADEYTEMLQGASKDPTPEFVDSFAEMAKKWHARAMTEIAPAEVTEEDLLNDKLTEAQIKHINTARAELEYLRTTEVDDLGLKKGRPRVSEVLARANEAIRVERAVYAKEQGDRQQHVPLTPNRIKGLLESVEARKKAADKSIIEEHSLAEDLPPQKVEGVPESDRPIDPGKRKGILQRAMKSVKGLGQRVGLAVREKIAREKPQDKPTVAQAKKKALEAAIKKAEAAVKPVTKINRIFALLKRKKASGVRFTSDQNKRVDKMVSDLQAAGYAWKGIDGTKVDGVMFTSAGVRVATEAEQHLRLDDSRHTLAVETTKPRITHVDTREEETAPEVVQHPTAKAIIFEAVEEAKPAEVTPEPVVETPPAKETPPAEVTPEPVVETPPVEAKPKRVTLKNLNDYLQSKVPTLGLVKGKGYFYFEDLPGAPTSVKLPDSIYQNKLGTSWKNWVGELDTAIAQWNKENKPTEETPPADPPKMGFFQQGAVAGAPGNVVMDEKTGEPLKVWHTTTAGQLKELKPGSYVSVSRDWVEGFAAETPGSKPVFISGFIRADKVLDLADVKEGAPEMVLSRMEELGVNFDEYGGIAEMSKMVAGMLAGDRKHAPVSHSLYQYLHIKPLMYIIEENGFDAVKLTEPPPRTPKGKPAHAYLLIKGGNQFTAAEAPEKIRNLSSGEKSKLYSAFKKAVGEVRSRTTYGEREEIASAPSYMLTWSNPSAEWFTTRKVNKGQSVKLDANMILVEVSNKVKAETIAENLPQLPLYEASSEAAEETGNLAQAKSMAARLSPNSEQYKKLEELYGEDLKLEEIPSDVDAVLKFMDYVDPPKVTAPVEKVTAPVEKVTAPTEKVTAPVEEAPTEDKASAIGKLGTKIVNIGKTIITQTKKLVHGATSVSNRIKIHQNIAKLKEDQKEAFDEKEKILQEEIPKDEPEVKDSVLETLDNAIAILEEQGPESEPTTPAQVDEVALTFADIASLAESTGEPVVPEEDKQALVEELDPDLVKEIKKLMAIFEEEKGADVSVNTTEEDEQELQDEVIELFSLLGETDSGDVDIVDDPDLMELLQAYQKFRAQNKATTRGAPILEGDLKGLGLQLTRALKKGGQLSGTIYMNQTGDVIYHPEKVEDPESHYSIDPSSWSALSSTENPPGANVNRLLERLIEHSHVPTNEGDFVFFEEFDIFSVGADLSTDTETGGAVVRKRKKTSKTVPAPPAPVMDPASAELTRIVMQLVDEPNPDTSVNVGTLFMPLSEDPLVEQEWELEPAFRLSGYLRGLGSVRTNKTTGTGKRALFLRNNETGMIHLAMVVRTKGGAPLIEDLSVRKDAKIRAKDPATPGFVRPKIDVKTGDPIPDSAKFTILSHVRIKSERKYAYNIGLPGLEQGQYDSITNLLVGRRNNEDSLRRATTMENKQAVEPDPSHELEEMIGKQPGRAGPQLRETKLSTAGLYGAERMASISTEQTLRGEEFLELLFRSIRRDVPGRSTPFKEGAKSIPEMTYAEMQEQVAWFYNHIGKEFYTEHYREILLAELSLTRKALIDKGWVDDSAEMNEHLAGTMAMWRVDNQSIFNIVADIIYDRINKGGPTSLREFKANYGEALKKQGIRAITPGGISQGVARAREEIRIQGLQLARAEVAVLKLEKAGIEALHATGLTNNLHALFIDEYALQVSSMTMKGGNIQGSPKDLLALAKLLDKNNKELSTKIHRASPLLKALPSMVRTLVSNIYDSLAANADAIYSKVHVVTHGETLEAVARKHEGVEVANLVSWNNLAPGTPLKRGQQLLVTPPAQEAPGKTDRQSSIIEATPETRSLSDQEIARRFNKTTRVLQQYGVPVSNIDKGISGAIREHGGAWAVRIALSDATNPTAQSLDDIMEEYGHVVFGAINPKTQGKLRRALRAGVSAAMQRHAEAHPAAKEMTVDEIRAIAEEEQFIHDTLTPIRKEELFAEQDDATLIGKIKQWWNTIIDYLLDAYDAIILSVREKPSPATAERFFMRRMKSYMNGKKPSPPLHEWLGLTMPEDALVPFDLVNPELGVTEFNLDTGTYHARPVVPLTPEAAAYNVMNATVVSRMSSIDGTLGELAGDMWENLTPQEQMKLLMAAQAQMDDVNVPMADGVILAPNGKASKFLDARWYKMVRTDFFHRWAGGNWMKSPEEQNAIIDPATGEPMILWHVTGHRFDVEQLDLEAGINERFVGSREYAYRYWVDNFRAQQRASAAWNNEPLKDVDERMRLTAVVARADKILDLRPLGSGAVSASEIYDFFESIGVDLSNYIENKGIGATEKITVSELMESGLLDEEMTNYDASVHEESSLPQDMQNIKAPQHKQLWVSPVYRFYKDASVKSLAEYSYRHPQDITKQAFDSDTITTHGWDPKHVRFEEETQPLEWDESKKSEFIEVKERPTVSALGGTIPLPPEEPVYIHDQFEPVAQQGIFTESTASRFAIPRIRDAAHSTPSLSVDQENRAMVDIAANNFMLDNVTKQLWVMSGAAKEMFGSLEEINKLHQDNVDASVNAVEEMHGSVDGSTTMDQLTGETRSNSAASAMAMINIIHGKNKKAAIEAGNDIDAAIKKAAKKQGMLSSIDGEYKDITWLYSTMWEEFRDLIRGLKKDTVTTIKLGEDGTKLTEMIKAIEKDLDAPTAARYTQALNKLLREASGSAFSNFGNLVDQLAQEPIDYSRHDGETSGDAIKRIAHNIRNTPGVQDKIGDNIDLANILASFMISNELQVHLLKVRRMSIEEGRDEIMALFEQARTGLPGDFKEAEKLARLHARHIKTATRLLQKLKQLKNEAGRAIANAEKKQRQIDFYNEASIIIFQARIKLEGILGEVAQWGLHNNSIINVPTSPNMPPDEAVSSKTEKRYTTRGYKDYEADLAAMTEWLDNPIPNPPHERGKTYYFIKTQRDALSMAAVREALDIDTNYTLAWSIFSTVKAPAITDTMRQIGLVEGLQMHQMFSKYAQSLNRAMDLGKYGEQWTVDMRAAWKAMGGGMFGMDQDKFITVFHGPALKHIEDNRSQLANMTEDEQIEKGISLLKDFYKGDKEAMDNWGALAAFYRTTAEVNMVLRQFIDSLGIGARVEEELGGETVYRKLIGNVWTVSRGFNDQFASTLASMSELSDTWGGLDSAMDRKNRKRYNFSELYQKEEGGAALRALLAPYFNNEAKTKQKNVLENFLLPIISKSGLSSFKAPSEAGSVSRRQVDSEELIDAFKRTLGREGPKDIVMFAEQLYVISEGANPDMEMHEYVDEVLNVIRNFYTAAKASQERNKEAADILTPPRDLMDARETEQFPGEWLVYSEMDRVRIRAIANRAAMHDAFGRDFGNFYHSLSDADNRLSVLKGVYDEIMAEVDNDIKKSGGSRESLLEEKVEEWRKESPDNAHVTKAMLVRAAGGGSLSKDLGTIGKQFGGFVTLAQGRTLDDNAIQEMIGVIAGGAVQGLKTIFNDLSALSFNQIRNMGLNATGTKAQLQTASTWLTLTANTLINAAHLDFRFNLEFDGLVTEYGAATESGTLIMAKLIAEKNTALKNSQMFGAEFSRPAPRPIVHGEGKAKKIIGAASGALVTLGRAVTGLRSVGMGQSRGGKYEAPGDVVLAPFGPFGTMALIGQLAAAHAVTRRVGYIVIKAAQHYADNPTDSRRISKDMLESWGGLKNDKAIAYVREQLALHGGIDIDRLAKEKGRELREDGKMTPFIDSDFVRMMHVVTQTTITMDANPMTRPPSWITSELGRGVNPLLGWAVRQGTEATNRQFKNEDYSKHRGFRNAASYYWLPYFATFGVVTMFALMRRKLEEDVIGYKSRDIPLNLDSPATFAKSMADSMDRVGSMGIVGSIINESINSETSRGGGPSNRILIFNTLRSGWDTIRRVGSQEHADYNNFLRPAIQTLGGGGYLQYVQTLNNTFSLDNAESRYTARINAKNIIAAAGRLIDLPVKGGHFVGVERRTSSPFMMQMQIAAYANDSRAFRNAHKQAIDATMVDTGKNRKDATTHVANNFAGNHPFRSVFKTYPTANDINELYRVMPEGPRDDVKEASRLYNHYLQQLGRNPFMGKGSDEETKAPSYYFSPSGTIIPTGVKTGSQKSKDLPPNYGHSYRHGAGAYTGAGSTTKSKRSPAEEAYIQSLMGK